MSKSKTFTPLNQIEGIQTKTNHFCEKYLKSLSLILMSILVLCISKVQAGSFSVSGSTLTLDLNVASQIVTVVTNGTTYTFTLSGGATNAWTGTTSTSVTVSGAVLTVTATGLTTFSTINITDSQTGNAVTFATSGASAYSDNINITLDNDPGAVTFNGSSSFTGSNALSITTSKYISFSSLSSLATVNGNLTLMANTQATPNDFAFSGIKVDSASVQVSGTGILTMKARGGSTGSNTTFNNRGIAIINGAVVKGGTTGTTIIEGKGFTGTISTMTRAQGVVVYAQQGSTATLSTNGSNISVTGYGANTTSTGTDNMFNCGVMVGDYAGSFNTQCSGTISSGGSGTVSITGYGGTAANPAAGITNGGAATWNSGVCVFGNSSQITSGGGNVSVTGTGGGTDSASAGNHGVNAYYGTITAGTNGNITVTGTGANIKGTYSTQGGRNCGVFLYGSDINRGTIQGAAGTGSLLVTGNGGGYQGIGVYVWTGAIIKSLGSGLVTVIGYGSTFSRSSCFGVNVAGNGASTPTITSGGGNLRVEGYGGGDGVANGTQVTGNYGVAIGSSGVVSAGGMGTTTVIGVGSSNSVGGSNHGVYVTSYASSQIPGYISSSGGNVIVTGTGGNNTNTTNGNTKNCGVYVEFGSYITAGGTGSVTVTGTGGGNSSANSGGTNYGVYLDPFSARGSADVYQTRITSSGGNVTVTGTGGGNGSSGGTNYGVYNKGLIKATGSGTVSITGNGGSSSGASNHGVMLDAVATVLSVAYPATVSSEGGNVTVNGFGSGSGSSNYGIYLNAGGKITSAGAGTVNVNGTGAASNSNQNFGVYLNAGTSPNFSTITSGGGNVSANGIGGGSGSSGSNYGVYLFAGGIITAGTTGNVNVTGTGGTTTGTQNFGVYLNTATATNLSTITSGGGNVTVTGTAGGPDTLSDGNNGVYVKSSLITAGVNGNVTVTGTSNSFKTQLLGSPLGHNGVSVTGTSAAGAGRIQCDTGTGNVLVTGNGGSGDNYSAGVNLTGVSSIGSLGSGTVTVIGYGSNTLASSYSNGVSLYGTDALSTTVSITSGGGDVRVEGYGSLANRGLLNGVYMYGSSAISAGGNGKTTVIGVAGPNATNTYGGASNVGVFLVAGSTGKFPPYISSNGGNVSVTGTGGGNNINYGHGVYLVGGGTITAGGTGSVKVTGTGCNNSSRATGVFVDGFSANGSANVYQTKITSGGGNITINGGFGLGSGSNYNIGVYIKGLVKANGSGTVNITGNGFNGFGLNNHGVVIDSGATVLSVFYPGTVSSAGGDVTVTGTGLGASFSGGSYGVYVNGSNTSGGGIITAGGSGSVTVTGTGGGYSSSNYGVYVNSGKSPFFSTITSGGGNVTVNGTGGGSGSGTNNYGVYLNEGGNITADVTGTVNVNGTGGASSTGALQFGVYVTGTNSKITSGGGNVIVNAYEGNSTTSLAVSVENSGAITTATNGGNITLNGNSFKFLTGTSISAPAADTVNLLPLSSNTPMSFTTATDTKGSLFLSSTELATITGGTINIGNANTGLITVSESVAPDAGSNLILTGTALSPKVTGAEITMASGKTLNVLGVPAINISIGGNMVNTQYDQLKVVADLSLSGKSLSLSGGYVPLGCDVFTIVEATSITGNFNGLANGTTLTFNGKTLIINYTATQVTLTVSSSPNTTTQPTPQFVTVGNSAVFTMAFCSTTTATIQWQVSTDGGITWNNLSGETSASLSFTALASQNQNQYRAVVTNSYGTTTTNAVLLTVYMSPLVNNQPMSTSVVEGTTATFVSTATGTPAPTVRWEMSTDGGNNWNAVSLANNTTFTFTTSLSQNGYQYRAVFTNVAGTISSNAATLTVTSACTPTTSTETISACDSVIWHGTTYTTSNNIAIWTGINAAGCDSMVTLHLTINHPTSSTETQSACVSYVWHGTIYTTSGAKTWTATNAAGCDSVVTLNLTINNVSSSTEMQSACGSYVWHGTTYTTSNNTATWIGTNAAGCDSVVTLNLTIKQPTTSNIIQTATGSYSWNGNTYNSSGTYTYHTTNSAGCDSTATLNLTINAAVSSNISNICTYIGTEQTLTYTASVAGASSYTWSLPANTQLISGQGTRSIVIKLLNGFASQVNKQIKVTPSGGSLQIIYLLAQMPVTPLSITPSSTNFCTNIGTNVPINFKIPKVVEVASNGTTASSYIWTAQNGTTNITHPNGVGENDTTVAITFASNFTSSNVTVQAVNACGVSGSRSYLITLGTPSQPGLISGPTNSCAYIGSGGQAATYTVPGASFVNNYNWTIPAGAIGFTGQGTSTISFRYPSDYTGGSISVTATNGCGTSATRTLNISRLLPATPGNIDVINTQTCPNRVYTYSVAELPDNATSLIWTIPAAGNLISGQGTRSITVSYPAGLIDGVVTARAISNCASSGSTRTLIIKLAPCAENTGNIYTKGTMNIPASLDVKLFPNPTTSSFNLQVNSYNSKEVFVKIMDIQGRIIKSFATTTFQISNIGNELKAGVYMVEVKQGDEVKIVRVVKY